LLIFIFYLLFYIVLGLFDDGVDDYQMIYMPFYYVNDLDDLVDGVDNDGVNSHELFDDTFCSVDAHQ